MGGKKGGYAAFVGSLANASGAQVKYRARLVYRRHSPGANSVALAQQQSASLQPHAAFNHRPPSAA
ncbi:hypothetical protein [Shewanella chilikensis]|uniref:hypothetical protein n=1 Tax=Shewanella chilikensis TaxID=558541 RepID=UPI0012FEBD8B|nr:hypothetical protein [Shewanella chilikensis]MCL1154819.1 hypothetical protein [Shewanella chilikensis]GGZ31589.1 hypothetical protein GCM10007105_18800 [Shewanella chilikensis]